jgi:hypothetical protein
MKQNCFCVLQEGVQRSGHVAPLMNSAMEVSGQLHAPGSFIAVTQPPVPIGGWVDSRANPGSWRTESKKISRSGSPQPDQCTKCTLPGKNLIINLLSDTFLKRYPYSGLD